MHSVVDRKPSQAKLTFKVTGHLLVDSKTPNLCPLVRFGCKSVLLCLSNLILLRRRSRALAYVILTLHVPKPVLD